MPSSLDTMDAAALEAEVQKLMRQEDEIRARKRELTDALNAKAAEAKAQALLEGLPPSQRDVLVQAVAKAARAGKTDG